MVGDSRVLREDVSIVLCGEAGQGIQTVEQILTRTLKMSGYNLFATKEFMSRIRGGSNSTTIRVSSQSVRGYSEKMHILIPLGRGAVGHVKDRVDSDTIVIGERSVYGEEYDGENGIDVPLSDVASQVGGAIYQNTVAAAILCRLFGVEEEVLSGYLRGQFSSKGEDVVAKNIEAAGRGYDIADGLDVRVEITADPGVADQILINGTQSVAIGALTGGCDFVSFYPMTPGTGVPTFLAANSEKFDTIVEQAEDEISAINMVVGSWYAGGRGMVSTSGGGFALMVEGLSLAAMLETPAVIHLAQRPGPATGVPTRTEQGDLLFALYAGHGEFPRAIYAPGNLEECFELTRKAFDVADRYQVPAFILTDQYLVDSYYNLPSIDVSPTPFERHIVETGPDYQRYEFVEGGITPRGIPGHGSGLVCADSDEHDEEGRITEDFGVRRRMVEKRLAKSAALALDAVEPVLLGDPDYEDLVIGWGSTHEIIAEAVRSLGREGLGYLHFGQVYPVPESTGACLERAVRTVLVEGNATAQFGKLLAQEVGLKTDELVLKWDGLPFSAELLERRLGEILDGS